MESDSEDTSELPETGSTELIAIATVGRPVGLKGWCRIFTFGSTLEEAELPYTMTAGFENPEVSVTLKELRKDTKGFKGLFEGYETREGAESLRNRKLFIEREKLPLTRENEFYHFELEGMSVHNNGDNACIGKVSHVYNYPTVDALEVSREDGSALIIPMNEQVIERIDKENKKIYVNDSALEELM